MARKRPKLKTSREIYNQIRWGPAADPSAYLVVYEERFSGMREVPLLEFVPDGDIPWHRVWSIRCGHEVVWDRETRVDTIGGSGVSHTKHDAATPRDSGEGDVHGDTVAFEARQPYRFDAERGVWSPSMEPVQQLPAAPGLLTVVTYNVLADHMIPELPTVPRWRALLSMLRHSDADIVGLQEVTTRLLEVLLREPWVRAQYAVSELPGGPDIDSHGQVLLTRLPVRALACASYARHKRVIVATLDVGGLPLEVAVVHLSSSRAALAAAKRARQARVLLAEMDRRGGAGLILGDFNSDDSELETFGQAGWIDVWNALRPDEPGFTFDPVRNTLAGWTSQSGVPRRYDRVLMRSPEHRYSPVSARMIGTEPLPSQRWSAGALYASDHAGVSVALRDGLLFPTSAEVEPTYRSAVVVMPPEAQWSPIQAIRKEHDRSYERWMPHINLIYGFIPEDGFEEAAMLLRAMLRNAVPFTTELAELSTFKHRASTSVWLRPDTLPDRALMLLQAELERLFPQCNAQSRRGSGGFTPHLTVASLRNTTRVNALLAQWQASWSALEFQTEAVALISRRDDQPFHVRHVIPLATSASRLPFPDGPLAACLEPLELTVEEREARARLVAVLQEHITAWQSQAVVHTMGSTALGLDVVGSDLDLVVLGPTGLDRQDALTTLEMIVLGHLDATDVRWIGGPGGETLRCLIQGQEVDLQYAEAPDGLDPTTPLLWGDDAIRALPKEAQQAINGLREAAYLKSTLANDWALAQAGIRALKAWARVRELDNKALGYLGGLSWAILGAWATLKGAAVGGSLAAWLASALALFESWDGLEPVGLNPEVV
ncbi:MAG: RNA repair domain-containing protein, partial [Myxococcota bacterium]